MLGALTSRFTGWGPELLDEVLEGFLGDKLGQGIDRVVYVCRQQPNLVVKISVGGFDFQNVAEMALWQAASDSLRRWLAPVRGISHSGRVLTQERCEPCPLHMLPAKVPGVLADDFHRGNVGLYEGRVVCLDYGRHSAVLAGANASKLVAAHRIMETKDRRSW